MIRTGPSRWSVLLLAAVVVAWGRLRRRRPTRPLPAGTPGPVAAPGPLPGSPRLVGVLGGTAPHDAPAEPPVVLLHEGRQVIGRAKDADVHLADLTVSPRHALVSADREGRVHVRDLGARNGLLVDGIPVASVELHDGNRLQLGDVQLVYRTDPVRDGGGRSGGELGENVGR